MIHTILFLAKFAPRMYALNALSAVGGLFPKNIAVNVLDWVIVRRQSLQDEMVDYHKRYGSTT